MSHVLSRRERAFTLIEILAVLAIMSVIAGLLVAAAVGARRKADNDRAESGISYIAAQIEAYHNKRGQLPPDTNEDGITTEFEIYQTLAQWNFPVPAERQVDPWGNPYVVVLQRDYTQPFPVVTGGAGTGYDTPPFDKIQYMYAVAPAVPGDTAKEIHNGVPATAFNGQINGFQVISAGPDGYLSQNGDDAVNADNFVNW